MKKLLSLIVVFAMILSFASCAANDDKSDDTNTSANVTTDGGETTEADTDEPIVGDDSDTEDTEAGPTELEFLAQSVEVWNFNGLSTENFTADDVVCGSRNGNAHIGEFWNLHGSADGGYENSACLQIDQLTKDWRYDAIVYFNDTAVKDWTGAKEVWVWIGAKDYPADFNLDLGLVDGNGNIFTVSKSKDETGNLRGPIYWQYENEWEKGKLNNWGHIVNYMGFEGFVRIPLDGDVFVPATEGTTLDLSNMKGITIYFEDYSTENATLYIDSIRILK